jgi:hypothetical protein
VIKTKEMIVDYRRNRTEHTRILIDGAAVEQVESFKFLGVHITNKLTWSKHTKTAVKRARQNLFPLKRLKIFGMGPQILKRFYRYSASDRQALQRVMQMAQYITEAKDLYIPGSVRGRP